LTPNELVLPFGGSYVCTNFGENRSRNATVRVLADRQTDSYTHTDANRFYNLSHAICYSYGTDNNNNNNNNNNHDNVYGAVIMTYSLRELPGSFDECRLSAGWPPTLRPNQPIWAVSPPTSGPMPIYLRMAISTEDCTARYYRSKLAEILNDSTFS